MRVGVFWVLDSSPGQSPQQRLEEVLEQTVAAEALGFDACWYAEHHFSTYGICPSPAVLLAAASQRTSRIRLGVAVSVLPLHDPVSTAEQYALVDVLSQGRLEMGVGSGYLAHEFAGFGIPAEEKRDRFDEALGLLQQLWTGNPVTSHGRFFQLDEVRLNVRPLQTPHPPLWVAIGRVQAVRHIASRGLPIMTIPYTSGLTDHQLSGVIDVFRAAAGPLPVAAAFHALAAPTQREAELLLGPALQRYLETRGHATPPYRALLDEDFVIWGDAERCLARIRRLESAGVTDLMLLAGFGGLAHREVLRSLELFAREVLPSLKQVAKVVVS